MRGGREPTEAYKHSELAYVGLVPSPATQNIKLENHLRVIICFYSKKI